MKIMKAGRRYPAFLRPQNRQRPARVQGAELLGRRAGAYAAPAAPAVARRHRNPLRGDLRRTAQIEGQCVWEALMAAAGKETGLPAPDLIFHIS